MIRSPAGFDGGDRIKRYLDYYQPSYGVMMLSAGQFSPASLFAAGEQGAWYDPSDLTTMFQDSAGTTPVTAVEQPVGLLLDKSKGLALGSELVTNGDFSSGTGWTLSGAGVSITGGQLVFNAAGATQYAFQAVLTVGKYYSVVYTVSGYSAGAVRIAAGGTNGTSRSANGTYTEYIQTTTNANFYIITASGSNTYNIDNVSVKELPGNHASQSTSASRPVLSARVNLLTYSEQFDNAAWAKTNTTVTANATIAPNGTTTADELFTTAATAAFIISQNNTIGAGSTALIYAKASGTGFFQLSYNGDTTSYANFNLSTGVLGTSTGTVTHSIESVGSGWFKLAVVNTSTAVTGIRWTIVSSAAASRAQTFAGTGAESIYIWGADLRVTNDGVGIPAYQRVAAATDYDTSGFPLYLKFDGTDDSLATASIDFSATDKMSVFAGGA